jgi:hypothetical protein
MTKTWLAAIAAVSFAAGVPAGATAGTNFSNGV